MSFSAGSIVVLKSGGPAMTVVSADEEGVECIWMSDVGELSRDIIPAVVLEQVEIGDDEEDEEDED